MKSIEEQVVHALQERNYTVATAESCTGGLVGDYFECLRSVGGVQ